MRRRVGVVDEIKPAIVADHPVLLLKSHGGADGGAYRDSETCRIRLSERQLAVGDLLRDAKELINGPKDWTRRTYRSYGGQRCAVGALRAAAKRLNDPTVAWSAHALLIDVARSRGFTNVETMNDRSSHAAVLTAFDQAIRAAERTSSPR